MSDPKGKIVFIDLETGGLNYYPRMVNGSLRPMNPIIQIACAVVEEPGLDIVDSMELKVQFNEAECDPQALVINGYQKDNWKEAKCKTAARVDLSNFLKRHATITQISKRTGNPYNVALISGWNISNFDYPYLKAFYENEFMPASYHILDCMVLAHMYSAVTGVKFPSLKMVDVAKHFNVAYEGNAHDALTDVSVSAKIYKAIMGDMKARMEF